MSTFLTLFSFTLANIGIYIYALVSKNSSLSGWKILLIPLIFFPILYLSNMVYSFGWLSSNKTNFSVAVVGILNLAIGILVFAGAEVFYLKQDISLIMIAGILLVIAGAVLIQW